jgi:MFS family permease
VQRSPWNIIWVLSITQIISWGSVFYAISVLITPIEHELQWTRNAIVGAFSLSMVVSGAVAVPAGILIDRLGGRLVMSVGSVAAAGMLALMSQVQSLPAFYAIWLGLGVVMAAVLYDAAFTVITAQFGTSARKAITTLTLAGGFASTVFWPLTQSLVASLGWRSAVGILALFNLLICAPLHLLLPKSPRNYAREHAIQGETPGADAPALRQIVRSRRFLLLAVAFTCNMLAFSALSIHLIPLLNERGFSAADAVWLAAVVGPMQVAGRVVEYMVGGRFRSAQVAAVAFILLPVTLVILRFAGLSWSLVVLFVALYGASNGIMTIARGTLPAEVFGRARYGALNGAFAAPVLASRSLGPLVAALIWSAAGGYQLVIVVLIAIAAIAAVSFYIAMKT